MNAYGSDTLGASDATDVLVSAVREGKPSWRTVLSWWVLPIASNMVSNFRLEELAAMSRTGTQLLKQQSIECHTMVTMKPSEDAKKAMMLSLSQEGLRKQIKEEGLLRLNY